MGKFSRGGQLRDPSRESQSKQRKRQIAERNRQQRRENLRKLSKKLLIVLVALLLIVVLVDRSIIRYDDTKIPDPYKETINSYFSDNPFRKSKLVFSAEDLSNHIKDAHPDISELEIKTPFWTNATFNLNPKDATFIWVVDDKRYIGDSTGVLFAIDTGSSSPSLVVLRDKVPIDRQIGDKVIASQTLDYIETLSQTLNEKKIKVSRVEIPAQAREIHVYIEGQPYFVKFSLDRSIVGQVDELIKVRQFIKNSNTKVSNYIDLRTEDKAFYR